MSIHDQPTLLPPTPEEVEMAAAPTLRLGSGAFRIALTRAQKGHAEWALAPMGDIAQEEHPEDRWYGEADLPEVQGDELFFPRASMAVDDLLYRLREQLRDMAEQADEHYPSSAETLAGKIETAALATGWVRQMGEGWRELHPVAEPAEGIAAPDLQSRRLSGLGGAR